MKRLLLLFTVLTLSFNIHAQDLPANMTQKERALYPSYLQNARQSGSPSSIVTPPNSPVRTIAEWEELQGIMVTYTSFTGMIRDIIRAAREECKVYVVCSNANTVINALVATGIDTSNVECVVANFNSVWSRDYGPWSAYTNEVDSLITIDWIYNRPRPFDDQIPVTISGLIGTTLYETTAAPWDLVHTGGNFMTDGLGTGFSSKLILNENNSKTEAEIDTIMKRFMGIDRYIKMDNLPYDVIHHIDMHMKLLNEETILMGEYPQGVADGPQIEANLQYVVSNFMSAFGTPYKVIRIPMPPDQLGRYPNNNGDYWTHTNASIINGSVLVPVYGGPTDSTAIRIFQEAMPGYNIVGINSRPSIPSLGAIHCIMKEIGSADPLLIVHQEYEDTFDDVNPYLIEADIKHRSGISTADLFFRTDTAQPYSSISMSNTIGNQWSASIPAQSIGTTVHYYIDAQANSGKTQVRPIVAPDGSFDFNVKVLTGLNEASAQEEFKAGNIFPNPASAITCIPVTFASAGDFDLQLFDMTGRMVEEIFSGQVEAGERKFFVDASRLSAGVYTAQYSSRLTSRSAKLVVK